MSLKSGFCDLGFAKVDIDRQRRRGIPEVVYCPGKTRQHLKKISQGIVRHKQTLLLTKLEKEDFVFLRRYIKGLKYEATARLGYLRQDKIALRGNIAVVSAGTSDIPVAEEAACVAQILGNRVTKLYDVGVAGVHRLVSNMAAIDNANVIIVVAGMEGALASLVSGLTRQPVIAVPTSCGYGANFKGLSALLTMLNSCSPGITVVNIDNGFGAGYFASLINK